MGTMTTTTPGLKRSVLLNNVANYFEALPSINTGVDCSRQRVAPWKGLTKLKAELAVIVGGWLGGTETFSRLWSQTAEAWGVEN